jgi:hypothetical protein
VKKQLKIFSMIFAFVIFAVLFAMPAHATYWKHKDSRISATCGETLATGNVVMIKSADGYAYKADANDAALRPAVGVVDKGCSSGGTAEIVTSGIISGYSSLTKGSAAYLSETAGAITQTAPSYTQKIGVAISGTDYQITVEGTNPADAELSALAGLTSAANAIPYFTGSGTASVITSSANMVSLLGSADYATARTNLGLAIGTNVQAYDADLTTYAGITPSANIQSLLGSADYATARTNLGLAIGTNVQAYDADLTTYAGITPSANVQTILGAADFAAIKTSLNLTIGTDVQAYDADLTTYAGITPSANIQSLLGSADYATARTNLGLAIGTNVQAYDADLTTYAGITPSANIQSLLGSADYATARTNLGVAIGTNVQAYDADLTTYAGITPTAAVQTVLGNAADGIVLSHRHRVTVAEINTGHEILPAITGKKYRIIEAQAVAYGGAVGTTTTVDLLGTQSAGSVKLVAFAQGGLTQSAVLKSGGTNAAVAADGASYIACDATTAITVGKTGGDADTATGVDFIITYVIE